MKMLSLRARLNEESRSHGVSRKDTQIDMPTLSLTMIVKDESAWLPGCLDSVKPIVDEIIVADTGSNDNTRDVARAYGARVIEVPWENDFAKARNAGNAHASGDWLLQLDADERLDPAGAAQIRQLVDDDGAGADVFVVTQANYSDVAESPRFVPVAPDDPYAAGFSGYEAVHIARLFRNHPGYEYRGAVHEAIADSVHECGAVIREIPVLIHHIGASKPQEIMDRRLSQYLGIARRQAEQSPEYEKGWFDLGQQAVAVGKLDEGERAYRHALRLMPEMAEAAFFLANLLLARGDDPEAEPLLAQCVDSGYSVGASLECLARIAFRRGNMAKAQQLAEQAATQAQTGQALLTLSMIRDVLGDATGAGHALREAIEQVPNSAQIRVAWQARQDRLKAESAARDGRHEDALRHFVAAVQQYPLDPLAHHGLGVLLASIGERDRAVKSFERALQLAPRFEEARMNLSKLRDSG